MTTTDDEGRGELPVPRRRGVGRDRVRRGALILASTTLVVLLGVWSQRRPIAANFINNQLAKSRVTASYQIDDIGFRTQRLTNLIIGDPARPDLVADWVEVTTAIGLSGARMTGLRAGAVRVRGRLVGNKLSFGALDRLLTATGKKFVLPAIDLAVADGRLRLETDYGVIGAKLFGQGRLDNGFAGRLSAISEKLEGGGCVAERIVASLAVRVGDGRPGMKGPVRAATARCGETAVAAVATDIDVTLTRHFDSGQGTAGVTVAQLRDPRGHLAMLTGKVDFKGSPKRVAGQVRLRSGVISSTALSAQTASVTGGYLWRAGAARFTGQVGAEHASLAGQLGDPLARIVRASAGTPVSPLIERLSRAVAAGGRDFHLDADLDVIADRNGLKLHLARGNVRTVSGARVALGGGNGVTLGPDGRPGVDGRITLSGGGLPDAVVALRQAAPGLPVRGNAVIKPYQAGESLLSLGPLIFTGDAAVGTRISATATLSGPVGDGRVDRLNLPLTIVWDSGARWVINPGCAPIGFDRLAIQGLVLAGARLRLCPVGGALAVVDQGKLRGGGVIAGLKLTGKSGSSPITLTARDARYRLDPGALVLREVALRLGQPAHLSRLDLASLQGRVKDGKLAGSFAGASGKLDAVPLLMTQGRGSWSVEGGGLGVAGALSVADADPAPRFRPLVTNDMAIRLVDNDVTATATFAEPQSGRKVTTVALTHDLRSERGHADFAVPGVVFSEQFQPDRLTRLTFGVIAEVVGTLSGEGHIRWDKGEVTSDGVFRTRNTSLDAAFGPVAGITTEIRFTDLLNLESAPGQIATVSVINPGVPVREGVVRYQTLRRQRVQVEGARWAFAGGSLTLQPTMLDFSEAHSRALTFGVEAVDAAQFLQQFDFKNLDATGVFDGTLPMIFDESGGKIEGGRLRARQGGGTIAYVGEVSQQNLGFWGNMAFQALKSLRYRDLDIVMNGPLAGEVITEIHFAGLSQGAGAKRNFLIRRLQKLPFQFNVRIKAPFLQLLDSVQSTYDPSRLIERNLPALIKAQNDSLQKPTPPELVVQPPESENKP